MRQLILMRHGKAETSSGSGDHPRLLSPRGRAEAAEAGRRLAAAAAPELALVSDSVRTRQTFDCIAPALSPTLKASFSRALYCATAEALLAAVRAAPDAAASLLIVGHNPGIGDLAQRLAAAGGDAALARGFPTSCFAVIEFDGERWADVASPGRLSFFLSSADRAGP